MDEGEAASPSASPSEEVASGNESTQSPVSQGTPMSESDLSSSDTSLYTDGQPTLAEQVSMNLTSNGKAHKVDEGSAIAPDGKRFHMPKTPSPMQSLKWSGQLTLPFCIQWSVILIHIFLLWFLSPLGALIHFLLSRVAYNLGIGVMLRVQSEKQMITQLYVRYCTEGEEQKPKEVVAKLLRFYHLDPKEYDPDTAHPTLNAWLLFRAAVDIILYSDSIGYVLFVIKFIEVPEAFTPLLLGSYLLGIVLCGFTWWAKSDAYRVVKDFAWYWGDFFFLLEQSLTFDRVFGMFPHPMYTVGYSFYYGLSLISQSHTVLYASIAAHFAQMLFLVYAENPHIEKTYPSMCEDPAGEESKRQISSTYFKQDLLGFKNFNPWRSSDMFQCVMVVYVLMQCFFDLPAWFYILQALAWRAFHTGFLGYILHRQSSNGNFVRSFLEKGCTKNEAFENWKRIYNLTLTLTWITFAVCGFMVRDSNFGYSWHSYITMQLFGLMLIGLNIWTAMSTYEVVGEFGWFYGDFFIEEAPKQLYYTGIYRYLNNPELYTGCAGYYGIAMMSGSWFMFSLALISQACILMSHTLVELPHMRKLYGNKVRSESGISLAFKEVVAEAVETNPEARALVEKLAKLSDNTQKLTSRARLQVEKFLQEGNELLDSLDLKKSPGQPRKRKDE